MFDKSNHQVAIMQFFIKISVVDVYVGYAPFITLIWYLVTKGC